MWRWKPSSQVLQQPVGGVGRAPEEQSHQRDDQAVVRASDGERDRVKSYLSEVCARRALTGTRQQQCPELSSDIVSTMTASGVDNRSTIMRRHHRGAHDIIIVYDVTDKESLNDVKVWMGDIDKHVPDGVNKLLVGNKCDLISQEVMSTDEAKELADSLNLRPER